jgi:phosphatidylethanolamine-binding protein
MAPHALEINEIDSYNPSAHTTSTSDVFSFGGNDQWLFDPLTELFDLSRRHRRRLTLLQTEQQVRLQHYNGIAIDPSKACLVIVDMQNYFIHPTFHSHPAGLAAVEPLLRTIESCREQGIQIAWLNWVISERDMQTMPPAVQRSFSAQRARESRHGWGVNLGSPLLENKGGSRVLWEGSWNADVYGPLEAAMCATDVLFHKNRMSGLWRQEEPLHEYLRQNEFQTLLFAGINTDQCLLSTMTDAYSWGWDVIMLKDCTGTATKVQGAQELVEHNVASNMGFVLDSDSLVNAIRAQSKKERMEISRQDSAVGL